MQVLAVAGAALVIALVIAWALSRYLTESLARVVGAARRLAAGDLEARVEAGGRWMPRELAGLGETFNAMAERVDAANARLSDALVQAQAGAEAKTTFLTTISHEIRTPMNGVLGFSQLLKESDLNAEQREIADHIHSAASALLGIVNDVLDMSKIEAGEHKLSPETLPVERLVSDVAKELGAIAKAKGIVITVDIAEGAPRFIVSDRTSFRQILVNLIGNAIKFTTQGGVHVTLAPHVTAAGENWARIDVEDTGIGIKEEAIGRLFTPFSQVDGGTTRRFGGTGLGLSISKRLANLLGGDIHVASTFGKGSRFSLLHPIGEVGPEPDVTEIPAAAPVTLPQRSGEPGVKRILVAEDNESNQWLLRRWLERQGYQVGIHIDGEQAYDAFVSESYDLLLTDYQMPVLDGVELTKRIRALAGGSYESFPIIGLTADAFEDSLRKCMEAGMDDVVTKPIDLVALAAVLKRHLTDGAETR